MTEEIDKMADNFVNTQDFTRVYSVARKAECGAFWKHGFLAGLKADKPKFHKVADGKYPSKEQLGKSFIVAFGFNERKQEYYSFDCAEYIDKGKFCTHTNNDDKVIAWCEIPTFDKE